jgi:hypothetical protein
VVIVVVPLMLAVLREVAGSTPGLDLYLLYEPIVFLFVLFSPDDR